MGSDLDTVKLVEQLTAVITAVDLAEEELFMKTNDEALEKIAKHPDTDGTEIFGIQLGRAILALKKLVAEGREEGHLPLNIL